MPFSGKVAKNRFLKASMAEIQATWDQHDPSNRGIVTGNLVRLYTAFGAGGFGIILTGNLQVDPYNLSGPGDMILAKDLLNNGRLEEFKKLVNAAKAHGSLFYAQISHAGRQTPAHVQPNPVSASSIKLDDRMGMSFAQPKELSVEEIKAIVQRFADTAEIVSQAGADGVQLHGAHGYLLAQFLASTTNKRTDQYGGSLENRSRIIVEIIEAIKARVPTLSIALKLNAVEFQSGGFTTEDCAALSTKLESLGVDWIELSGGTYEDMRMTPDEEEQKRESTKRREAFFLKFAEMIRPSLQKTRVYVTGGFRTAEGMVRAIENGSTEGIGLARPVAEEPDLPNKILSGEASAAIKTLVPANDSGLGGAVGGLAMKQIGDGQSVILDSSNAEHMQKVFQTLQAYQAATMENAKQGIVKAGWPELVLA
ncbi:NADH-dependent flavin oxidoreductase [Tilletia horrida]|nr:NADH-dependent flavin oxidoreductase [Tilletia horrida]